MAQPFAGPCDRGLIAAAPIVRVRCAMRQRTIVLAACVLASSMAFIDGSALTVALPRLRTFFHADYGAVQWVLNGYTLALAALTLVGGALGDVYGKARMLALGSIGFGLASAACIVAPSIELLIAARVVQGVAAAILTPSSLALIGAVYPKAERNRAIGVWAAASALTTAGGPVLGGWLTQAFGWQWVFAINPPLALIAVALLYAAPRDRREGRRFDLLGAAILAVALAALTWALTQIGPQGAREHGLAAATAVLGVVALGGYALWERASAHPMTPPRLTRNRAFVGLNIATLLLYCGLSIMFFLLSFDLIDRRHLTPEDAGLALLPFTLGMALLSRPFGTLADKAGARTMLICGPLGAAAAFVLLALGKDASLVVGVLVPVGLLGVSFAMLVAPLTAAVLSSLGEADEGLASGVNNAVARIAQMGGIALAAGLASYAAGYRASLLAAAAMALIAAFVTALLFQSKRRRKS
jgi:EmrB/QacA subfamily drug resistance transporter